MDDVFGLPAKESRRFGTPVVCMGSGLPGPLFVAMTFIIICNLHTAMGVPKV